MLSEFSKQKLTELADIIETADKKYKQWRRDGKRPMEGAMFGYDQTADIDHPCGSPGCAWGHWLSVHPEDRKWERSGDAWEKPFGIEPWQANRLFDYHGCDFAGMSATKAVRFIRNAVKTGQL